MEESAFSALLELDEGDYPFQGLLKCSTPVTVLFSHFSGSAVDTTADYANAWGLTTIGTHTAGATGNLMVVPLCTGYAAVSYTHLDVYKRQVPMPGPGSRRLTASQR